MMVSQESPDPDIFYTYFCLCNASDHKIDVMLAFHGEYGYKVMGWVIDHGEKFTGRLETFKSKGAAGLISSFTPILARLEVYYDVDNDEYGNIKYPSGIDERYSDFTQRFKTRQICDQGQWIYEEFTPRRARWTYIFTNEDYERAKMMSEKPD